MEGFHDSVNLWDIPIDDEKNILQKLSQIWD